MLSCQFCGKSITSEFTFCPHCGKKQQPLSESEPATIALSPKLDHTPNIGKTCPYCQTVIKPGAPIQVCPVCDIPHHRECWIENGNKCTTFGCKGTRATEPERAPLPQPPPQPRPQPTTQPNTRHVPEVESSNTGVWVFVILAIIGIGIFFASSDNKPFPNSTTASSNAKRLTYPSGDVYVGAVRNDKPEGQGEMTYKSGGKYVGTWSGGKRQGKGKMVWSDGQWYEGDWQDDQAHGQGVMKNFSYVSGLKLDYKGGMANGKFHGSGVAYIYKANGSEAYRYEGQYVDGFMNDSSGTISFANGDKYVGGVKNDLLDGRGTFYWASGKTRTGNWRYDKPVD